MGELLLAQILRTEGLSAPTCVGTTAPAPARAGGTTPNVRGDDPVRIGSRS